MARYRVRDEKLLKQAFCGPNGGWVRPNAKKLQAFFDRIQDEAVKEFGVDSDGDAVVLVRIVDNSRNESNVLNYSPVPRLIEEDRDHPYSREMWNKSIQDPVTKKWSEPNHTPEEEETRNRVLIENQEWRRRMIWLNFSLAQTAVDQLMREDSFELIRKAEGPAKKRLARIKKLEELKAKWDDPFAYYEKMGYLVDRKSKTYTYRETDRSVGSKRREPVAPVFKIEKPESFNLSMAELKALKKFKPAKEVEY